MFTKFDGCCHFGFGEFAFLFFFKIPFQTMDYSPWSSKNLMNQNQLKKLMQVEMTSHACTPILVGVASPVSEIKLAYSP